MLPDVYVDSVTKTSSDEVGLFDRLFIRLVQKAAMLTYGGLPRHWDPVGYSSLNTTTLYLGRLT